MSGGVPHAPKQSGGGPGRVPGGVPGDGVLGGVRAAADRGGVPGGVVGCEVPDGVRAAAGGGASTSAERVLGQPGEGPGGVPSAASCSPAMPSSTSARALDRARAFEQKKRLRSDESGGGVLERVCKARGGRLEGKGKGEKAFARFFSSAQCSHNPKECGKSPRGSKECPQRPHTHVRVRTCQSKRTRTVRALRCALADRLVKMASCTHARER